MIKEFAGNFVRWCASPLGLLLVISAMALLLKPKKSRLVCYGLWIFLVLFSMPLTGKYALHLLGNLAPDRPPQGEVEQVIVLAGGAIHDGWGYLPSTSSVRRLRAALPIKSKRPLLISGIEGVLMASWLEHQDFKPNVPFQLERRSTNTKTNLFEATQLLKHLPTGSQLVLVTDRFHAPRASLWANYYMPQMDWRFVLPPDPTLPPRLPYDLLPSPKGLEYTSLALRETIALLRDWCRCNVLN